MKRWTKEEKAYLREIALNRSTMEMRDLMCDKFNYPFTLDQIRSACSRYGYKSGLVISNGNQVHKFTEEEKAYLREIAPGRSRVEMTQLMRDKFNYPFTEGQIINACNRYGIKNGLNRTFKKGHETWNKGKTGYMGANETSFKKGQVAHNKKTVGSERIDKDGYHLVKVEEGLNSWKYKHNLIWEKANGPIPATHAVIFADGNKDNLDLNNLVLVHRRELLVMNREGFIHQDADLTKTGLNVAKLVIKTQEIKKRLKDGE